MLSFLLCKYPGTQLLALMFQTYLILKLVLKYFAFENENSCLVYGDLVQLHLSRYCVWLCEDQIHARNQNEIIFGLNDGYYGAPFEHKLLALFFALEAFEQTDLCGFQCAIIYWRVCLPFYRTQLMPGPGACVCQVFS
ncbi:UV radiation resistance-associated protein [Cricetulus griseus]|nr:UV radiation resistance-associated protein [Cricetulus griseus]